MIQSLRIKHWFKNVVIFAAPLFALEIAPGNLLSVLIGFFCFSFLASAFYLVNDVADKNEDRNHPVKRNRPIAGGELSVTASLSSAAVLGAGSIAGAFWLNTDFGLILCIYALIQLLYNWKLKHLVVLDIMAIAIGFVLRALSGAVIVDVPTSGWFLLCVGFLAFFLGIEKRKAELTNGGDTSTRKVLGEYTIPWLQKMENLATSAAIITYSLWTIEADQSKWFLLTIPIVVFVIFKYQQLSETEIAETPEVVMLKSPQILLSIILWAALSLLILLAVNDFII